MSFIVAIDGTAGSGKGTMANAISEDLGFLNIDTGATYRCVALASIRANVPYTDVEGMIKLLDDIEIDIQGDHANPIFLLNGEDVTKEIRSAEVTKIVSQVSCIPEVRYKLVEIQRKLAVGKNVVLDGRDIGTYVFPNADVKIYLDATEEVRAKRRWLENQEKGIDMTYEEVLENIKMRDKQDKEKEIGALKLADDATYIDTTDLTIEEVKNKIEDIIKEKWVK